ncbi:TATA-binding protein-associated factor 172-like [Liolophura sinensis]|uniref:TATA-binding protein-associated factor 172-like n=1 Tax=Liolophura sinensis TaxID=3198878 RepID=UPI00315858EA
MSTRLDRLFLLLETGSSPLIRKSAAAQIGQVQKLHPHELNNLLAKVHVYLRSTSWDTRIAAAQAVEAITRNVPQWQPRGGPKKEEGEADEGVSAGRLAFKQFDVNKVLTHGASLLGSEGGEYDVEETTGGLGNKEMLAKQRQMLNKRLGLDITGNMGLEMETFFTDDDLVSTQCPKVNDVSVKKVIPVKELVKQQLQDTSGLSARERNKAKRKAKLWAKQISRDSQGQSTDSADTEPAAKKIKPSVTASQGANQSCDTETESKLSVDSNCDNTVNMDEAEEWPFESFCEVLLNDLFHSSWETRHGASTGLREVIKLHGRGAGKTTDTPCNQLEAANQSWLSDVALRLLCVLALDRFGDFVADEVVAPVRETTSQSLGVVLRFLDTPGVQGVLGALLQLLAQTQWEVRHGGLLGLKYMLAVRQDMTEILLPMVLPPIFYGLQDIDDDVRAVAASSLLPVSTSLIKHLPAQVPQIVACLWETLMDLDELTASTNSIMMLLSTLLSYPQGSSVSSLHQPLSELVPRLWPFLRHNITSVRGAALETLHTLLSCANSQNTVTTWLAPILPDCLRHVYQRSLLEDNPHVLAVTEKVWAKLLEVVPLSHLVPAACLWLGVWLCLVMQPARLPYDPSYLIEAKHRGREQTPGKARLSNSGDSVLKETRDHIGGISTLTSGPQELDITVTRARITSARLLGKLCSRMTKPDSSLPLPPDAEAPADTLGKLFLFHLLSKSAIQRFAIILTVQEWASASKGQGIGEELLSRMSECLNEAIYFDEIALPFTRMQTDCREFISLLSQQGVELESKFPPGTILSLEQAIALTSTVFDQLKTELPPLKVKEFEARRAQLQAKVMDTFRQQQSLTFRVQSGLAGVMILMDRLPDKLNPIIRPLMESVKKEENPDLQNRAGKSLSLLLQKCSQRNPSPNSKIIKNLCSFLCCDPKVTPPVQRSPSISTTDIPPEVDCTTTSGILTLLNLQKGSEGGRRRGWLKRGLSAQAQAGVEVPTSVEETESAQLLANQRRGAEFALMTITSCFAESLPQDLPTLWQTLTGPLTQIQTKGFEEGPEAEKLAQEILQSFQLIESMSSALHQDVLTQVCALLPVMVQCLHNPYTAVRHMAARALAALSQLRTLEVMQTVVEHVVPLLGASDADVKRQGAVEAIANLLEQLGLELVPYMVLLVVPVLGRMSDQNDAVRLMASNCFASLIRLMPLEAGIPDPPEMDNSLVKRKDEERKFLEQLLDSSKLEDYKIDVPIQAELRKYQQDGVNWLAFLNKYKLHGILCDDMGLGKTLQSICILAGDHHRRDELYKSTKQEDCCPLPSIVVCPPTLTGHWLYEIDKFVSKDQLNPLQYTGPPCERARLQKRAKKHNVIIASYDIVRNDIDFFSSIRWNYCILDEGHIIKNGKTKLTKAVKQLRCNHRLILSGTPIQNNVLDLWSLFDFLMPGFLGTEKQFQCRYGRPILQSRDAKSTSKEQEAGALAMESLHKQVLPFVLRRLKEDVLQDLPPKIIQDYYCDLSPLQIQLYEDFARSRARKGLEDSMLSLHAEESKAKVQGSHIFQALQYLRKVCNHPALVLTSQHPKYEEVMSQLQRDGTPLHDLHNAPKLTALRQLLQDCGIGVVSLPATGQLDTDTPVVGQHRVLLFCQLKSMLDLVENDLLKCHMPSVTYLRLDGSVPAGSRHTIVNRFNNDPSIDLLLLTTHVGGLGLNLTGADTVIFVEHDWNPMKDLQAMDRAHRIGQKRVVNVYRLITRGTLEEKIMGLQKFKLTIANTVISQENSSLKTMGTDQLLELFTLDEKNKGSKPVQQGEVDSQKETMKSVLENLDELWDEKQYETEYNLDSFIQSLQ